MNAATTCLIFGFLGTLGCSSEPASPASTAGSAGQPTGGAGMSSGGTAAGTPPGGSSNTSAGGAGSSTAGGGGTGGAAGAATGGAGGGSGGGAGAGGMPAKAVCPEGPFPAPMAGQAQQVCQDFDFQYGYLEGPTWVASQNAFYFSNFPQGADGGTNFEGNIIKYTLGGDCELFLEGTGTNGLVVANNGNLLGATHKTRSITEWNITTKAPKILVDMFEGKQLESPNDLVQAPNGTIYFSNPDYERGNRPAGTGRAIFRIDPQGTLSLVMKVDGQPNGVTISPKADRLYVVGYGQWDLDTAGVPSNNRAFNFGGADGIATDCAGNIYSSGGSIRSADGQDRGNFNGGTNLAFGGPEGKTLLVVSGGSNVRTIAMNVPGLP
jgi:gluconolactonase